MTKSIFRGETVKGVVELVRLSGPVILARAGMVLMMLADTLMVGQHDSDQLSYLAISLIIIQPLYVCGLGLIMGTQVMASIAHGGGRLADCGLAWRRGVPYAFCLG
ncbi:MAG: MATE family efflux transporter, partial [Rhodospirillales bacterium]|nr:MATE family efflux transporter [Rhodospirillales bacterium]